MFSALSLPTKITVAELFKSLDDYISGKLWWSFCVGICTDGATTWIKALTPQCESMHCVIHREMLPSRNYHRNLTAYWARLLKVLTTSKHMPLTRAHLISFVRKRTPSPNTFSCTQEKRWISQGRSLARVFYHKRFFLVKKLRYLKRLELEPKFSQPMHNLLSLFLKEFERNFPTTKGQPTAKGDQQPITQQTRWIQYVFAGRSTAGDRKCGGLKSMLETTTQEYKAWNSIVTCPSLLGEDRLCTHLPTVNAQTLHPVPTTALCH